MEISELVKAGIQQEILKALNDAPEYINNLVDAALNQDVNDYGSKPSYGETKQPYLEYVVEQQLRVFAAQAIRAWLEDNESTIRASIINRMTQVDIAEAFADAVSKQIKDNWGISVQFERQRDK